MVRHKVGTREEWLAARVELLEREKELTRRSDELARQRLELPWVPVEEEYSFETEDDTKTLAELFDGRSQLLVYHFMFGPQYTAGCPICSAAADTFDGAIVHLNHRDVTFLCVSRAPLEKLQAYKRRMGWGFPWASSLGSDFNFDFGVSFTEEQQREGFEYNYRSIDPTPILGRRGKDPARRHRCLGRDRSGGIHDGGARPQRLRALRGRRLPHLLDLCARTRVPLGLLPAARQGATGTQRGRPVRGFAAWTGSIARDVVRPPRRARGREAIAGARYVSRYDARIVERVRLAA